MEWRITVEWSQSLTRTLIFEKTFGKSGKVSDVAQPVSEVILLGTGTRGVISAPRRIWDTGDAKTR